jgi:hypothetical protein
MGHLLFADIRQEYRIRARGFGEIYMLFVIFAKYLLIELKMAEYSFNHFREGRRIHAPKGRPLWRGPLADRLR